MSYAIYKTSIGKSGHPIKWVLLTDGAWATTAHDKPTPPYFHVARIFNTKRDAAAYLNRTGEAFIDEWPSAADRENACT